MLLFTSAATVRDLEITGHPYTELFISADAKDASFFVYLEDVAPDGSVTYITEGQLRAAFRKTGNKTTAPYQVVGPYHTFHKEDKAALIPNEVSSLSIAFQPISYQIKKGHRLQLSIANADINHFELTKEKPENIKVFYSKKHPSKLVLPITN